MKCYCRIFTVIQRPSQLPKLRRYKYLSCQTIIMLGVKEWQEWELDHFSLTYNQAESEREREGRRGKEKKREWCARNWRTPIYTLLCSLLYSRNSQNCLAYCPSDFKPFLTAWWKTQTLYLKRTASFRNFFFKLYPAELGYASNLP